MLFIGIVSGSEGTTTNSDEDVTNSTVSAEESAFQGDCGISATAEMTSSIIGYPELIVSIKNISDKTISAIKFYAVPYDVYGEEISGWTSQNYLYTDTAISKGQSTKITYDFIEDSVKTIKLYVHSVYFEDGTEWGNKDATKSTILKYGALIEVGGTS